MSVRAVGLVGVHRDHGFTVTEDRDAIGEREHLVEPVRDVDRAHAAAPELVHDVEQHGDLLVGQRGARLVQDEHFGLFAKRLRNLDELALPDAEIADARARAHVDPQRESSLSVSPNMRSWSTKPKRRGSWPRKMFSATVISGTSASS